jgi:amino acid transporter
VSAPTGTPGTSTAGNPANLQRAIGWKDAFWVASGVPALVLFSIGMIAGTVGTPAFAVWTVSMLFGFIQSFTYAEIAGLFPNKSGGASVYGAAAWIKYSKLIAPLSVWCNWLGWTPVLSLGCTIAAGYVLNALAPVPASSSREVRQWMALHPGRSTADAVASLSPAIRNWSLLHLNFAGLRVSLGATFLIGALLTLAVFAIQHRGIAGTARVQLVLGLAVIAPLLVVAIVPFFNGHVSWVNFTPFVPLATRYSAQPGSWDIRGWTLVLGGVFIAAWSTYAFETAICYTSEFKNPASDTFKAIFFSGLLCMAVFMLVPFTFQGFLGVAGMISPGVVDGTGVAAILASMVSGNAWIGGLLVVLMMLALLLSAMTAMAGSSRTLYQGSMDGWLPRYLSKVNHHGAPTRAMWTDLTFNLILLAFTATDAESFTFVLALSNCAYLIFNFLNLNAGWIHRLDNGHVPRPWKAPTWVLAAGVVLAFVNAMLLGAGAQVWNHHALVTACVVAAMIIPIFWVRHYIQDGGKFPAGMLDDLGTTDQGLGQRKAGILPYLALAGGVLVVFVSSRFFHF